VADGVGDLARQVFRRLYRRQDRPSVEELERLFEILFAASLATEKVLLLASR
jgi:hypothetical protein